MESKLQVLFEEAKRLSGIPTLFTKKDKRFYNFVYTDDVGRTYDFAKIEITTGDIYSANSRFPHGNLFSQFGGKESIDADGVIVNNKKKALRLEAVIA